MASSNEIESSRFSGFPGPEESELARGTDICESDTLQPETKLCATPVCNHEIDTRCNRTLSHHTSTSRFYVVDRVVVVSEMFRDTIMYVAVPISTTVEAATAKAVAALRQTRDIVRNQQIQLRENFSLARQQILSLGLKAQGRLVSGCLVFKTQALEAYIQASQVVQNVPLPAIIPDSFHYVRSKVSAPILMVTKSCFHVQQQLGDTLLTIKVRCADASERSRSKVLQICTQALKVAESNIERINDGVVILKGRVNGAVVFIRIKRDDNVEFARSKVSSAYASTKSAVEQSPFVNNVFGGVKIVKGKVSDVLVYSTDRYTHSLSFVNKRFLYMKSVLVSTHGRVKARVTEVYFGTWSSIQGFVDNAILVSIGRIEAAKIGITSRSQSALLSLQTRAQASSDKASEVVSRTKALAADKPIVAGATGGALVLGTGGGAAGLAAGSFFGAACGVPLALFTFGLSIPVGAIVCGGAGSCVGVVIGGAAGAAGGSAVGVAVSHRAHIRNSAEGAISTLDDCRKYVGDSATMSAKRFAARLRSGTGGTV